jgi:hypothetical protein
LIETDGRGDKMAIGLGCGVGGTKPPIRRAALLAKQSPGDGTVDLAKQSHRKAQAVLAEQSQREARVGFGGAEPSLHLSPRGPSGERCRGRASFGETKPTGGVAWIWRNKPNAAAQIRLLDQKTAEESKCCTTDHAPGTDESAGVEDHSSPPRRTQEGGTEFNFPNDVPHFDQYLASERTNTRRQCV